jgi:hypothetical protein
MVNETSGLGTQREGLAMSIYTHVPHPHTIERLEHKDKPVKTADIVNEKATTKLNAWLAP